MRQGVADLAAGVGLGSEGGGAARDLDRVGLGQDDPGAGQAMLERVGP